MLKHFIAITIIIALSFSTIILPVLAEFDPNFIISDAELTNDRSMTVEQVQQFLEHKNSALATYIDPNTKWTASYTIDFFSRFHDINPKYSLVLLQKEQSLIEDQSPSQGQLDWATGYGICDNCSKTDPKVQKYKGFFNQIDYAVSATRFYLDNPDKFKYQTGEKYDIDDQTITIGNDATRALYIYTPHIHGNELFYNIWQKWFAVSYLDGTLLQNDQDGGIYLIRDGKKHPFLSKSAYISRYNSFDRVIPATPSDLENYPTGAPIEYPNYSLLQIPTGGIYLLDDDTLRPITSKQVFKLIGFNPEEIIPVSSNDIFPYKIGRPITEKDAYPTGALLQDNTSGGVYYVEYGQKAPIISRDLIDLYYKDKKIIAISPTELEQYQKIEPIKLKDGELAVSKTNPTVYFISSGQKYPFASEADFLSLGYKFSNVITVDNKVLELHPTGADIKAQQ